MSRSKIQKDLMKMLKNVKKVGAKSAKSTVTLYAVLVLAVINLFVFINNQDNESLFLFLVISTIVYMKTNNMIVVLLVPLLTVNLLIYLRALLMNRREGFSSDKINLDRFVKFVVKNTDSKPEKDDKDGRIFYFDFVKPVIEELDPDNLENISVKGMKNIMSLFGELNQTDESDIDSKYIKKMVKAFNEKFDDSKDKEPFTVLEGYEDEEDDEEVDEEVDEDEEEEVDEEVDEEEEVDLDD